MVNQQEKSPFCSRKCKLLLLLTTTVYYPLISQYYPMIILTKPYEKPYQTTFIKPPFTHGFPISMALWVPAHRGGITQLSSPPGSKMRTPWRSSRLTSTLTSVFDIKVTNTSHSISNVYLYIYIYSQQ